MPRRHTLSRTSRLGFQARQQFRPRLEVLEQRTLLACEVFVDDVTRTLFVQGDGGDNRIAVVTAREEVRVNCDRVATRVSLSSLNDVQVLAGSGNDSVIADQAAPIPIRIKGQDGDDVMHVRNENVTPDDPLAVIGGGGNDTVIISAAHAAAIIKIFGVVSDVPDPEFQFFNRETGNLLAHLFVQETEAITLKTGDGDDRVEMHDREGLLAGIDWSIHTGSGADSIWIDLGFPVRELPPTDGAALANTGAAAPPIAYNIGLDTGRGNDDVQVSVQNLRADLHLRANLGLGDDDINAVMGVDPQPFRPAVNFNVSIDGDAGSDTLTTRVIVNPVTLVGFNPQPEPPIGRFNVVMRGGLGDDDINAEMGVDPDPFLPNVVTEVHVNGGAGDDNISVVADINAVMGISPEPFLPNVVTRVSVNGGEGHDTISVLADINAVMGIDPEPFLPNVVTEVNVNGGAGHDSISVVADINAVMGVQPDPFMPNVVTRMNINGGAGHDNISVVADINAVMGVQPDPFMPNVSIDVTIDGGLGNDVLTALFHADPARPTIAALRVALLAGAGDDELQLRWTADAFSVLAFADGGSGFDTGLFSPGVRHINVEQVR